MALTSSQMASQYKQNLTPSETWEYTLMIPFRGAIIITLWLPKQKSMLGGYYVPSQPDLNMLFYSYMAVLFG